jgi:hypothetical protein
MCNRLSGTVGGSVVQARDIAELHIHTAVEIDPEPPDRPEP